MTNRASLLRPKGASSRVPTDLTGADLHASYRHLALSHGHSWHLKPASGSSSETSDQRYSILPLMAPLSCADHAILASSMHLAKLDVGGAVELRSTFTQEHVEKHYPVLISGLLNSLPKVRSTLDEPSFDSFTACCGDAVVGVSCAASGSPFSGDLAVAESVAVSLRAFLAFYRSAVSTRTAPDDHGGGGQGRHFDQELEGLDLYLAQCPIYERPPEGSGDTNHAPLAALLPHIDTPDVLISREDIVTINLWMSMSPTCGTIHYDSQHNILLVVKGMKQVHLYSPAMTHLLHPRPAYSASANHSTLHVDPGLIFTSPKLPEAQPLVATLHEGDAVFIPEGWWHQVDSSRGTIAVNYWFKGFVDRVLNKTAAPHVLPFYLRATAHKALEIEYTRIITDARAQACRECRRLADAMQDGIGPNPDDLPWERLLGLAVQSCGSSVEHGRQSPLDYVLQAMPWRAMQDGLPRASLSLDEDAWVNAFLSISPETTESLTRLWDEAEAVEGTRVMQEFFVSIYTSDQAKAERITDHILSAKDRFARDALCRLLLPDLSR